jgi:hypothetical protein
MNTPAHLPSCSGAPRIGPCQVLELRRYQLHPGRRHALIDLFEQSFIEPQQALGMAIAGPYRDLHDADAMGWLRGFTGMAERGRVLPRLHGGPVWATHREAANATMRRSDDVHLLRQAWPGPVRACRVTKARTVASVTCRSSSCRCLHRHRRNCWIWPGTGGRMRWPAPARSPWPGMRPSLRPTTLHVCRSMKEGRCWSAWRSFRIRPYPRLKGARSGRPCGTGRVHAAPGLCRRNCTGCRRVPPAGPAGPADRVRCPAPLVPRCPGHTAPRDLLPPGEPAPTRPSARVQRRPLSFMKGNP